MRLFDGEPGEDPDSERDTDALKLFELGLKASMAGDRDIIVTDREIAKLGGREELDDAVTSGYNTGYFIANGEEVKPDVPTIHVQNTILTGKKRALVGLVAATAFFTGVAQFTSDSPGPSSHDRPAVIEPETPGQTTPDPVGVDPNSITLR